MSFQRPGDINQGSQTFTISVKEKNLRVRQGYLSRPLTFLLCYFIIDFLVLCSFGLFFVCLFLFRAAHVAYGSSQSRGGIGDATAGLRHSHSNARSLTHWVRPRLKPITSWSLVGFVSAVPWWELLFPVCFLVIHFSIFLFANFLYNHWNLVKATKSEDF